MLRTRAPVATSIATVLPLDLHVLGLPLAFILSQDQTLHPMLLFRRPSLGGLVLLMSVDPSTNLCCPTISKNFSLGQSPWQRGIKNTCPKNRVAKVTPISRSRKLFLVFFSWRPETLWETSPFLFVPDPRRPLRGCKGTNIILIRNNSQKKNMRKSEIKRQDPGSQQLQTESFFGKRENN